MCGRFVQSYELNSLEERFKAIVQRQAAMKARYNVAPGQAAAVILEGPKGPCLDFFQWGLVPSWASDPRIGYKMINAREETVWDKASYRNAIRYRRCIVPVNGFYEWLPLKNKHKQAVYFQHKDGRLAGLAGLWEVRADREGGELFTFCIVTTSATPWMRRFHARMPVLLSDDAIPDWLNHTLYRPDDLHPLLASSRKIALQAYPVSSRVNRVLYDDADCVEPVGPSYRDDENPLKRGAESGAHRQIEFPI
jgi:putative SOS response-associated peptidase YedK